MFWCSAGRAGCVRLLRCRSRAVCSGTPTTPQRPLVTSRFFSLSARTRCPSREGGNPPLKQWALAASPFGTVRAQLGCSISVRPLDLHAYPEADRVFVAVHGPDTGQEVGLDHLHVHYDDQSKELLVSAGGLKSSASVHLTAPIKSNLFITTQGEGNVQVKNMECDICKVQTEKGNCLLHSVKGHRVEVRSHGGHVTGVGSIHGNVDISTRGDGVRTVHRAVVRGRQHAAYTGVDVQKLQGNQMNISTERGPLKVKAIYAESSCLSSCSGRVQLGNVHGKATVKNMSGDTVIDGSNSVLEVSSHSGAIDVYVGDGGSAQIHSQEGAVCVRVPSSLKAEMQLCGTSVDISPDVVLRGVTNNTSEGQTTVTGHINGKSPADQRVRVRSDRSSVRLKTQSWFQSLKLGADL